MDLSSLYTELILEHSRNCDNKRHLDCATCTKRGHNPSCGDDITIELLMEDGKIVDAAFTGTGCAISQASTSMMIDLVKGRSAEEAQGLSEMFLGMIKFQNISNMPARVKCAVLAWHTLTQAIQEANLHA